MANIRTANKHHKRAIVTRLGREKAAKEALAANSKPAKSAA